jgi:hypothetical protein
VSSLALLKEILEKRPDFIRASGMQIPKGKLITFSWTSVLGPNISKFLESQRIKRIQVNESDNAALSTRAEILFWN